MRIPTRLSVRGPQAVGIDPANLDPISIFARIAAQEEYKGTVQIAARIGLRIYVGIRRNNEVPEEWHFAFFTIEEGIGGRLVVDLDHLNALTQICPFDPALGTGVDFRHDCKTVRIQLPYDIFEVVELDAWVDIPEFESRSSKVVMVGEYTKESLDEEIGDDVG